MLSKMSGKFEKMLSKMSRKFEKMLSKRSKICEMHDIFISFFTEMNFKKFRCKNFANVSLTFTPQNKFTAYLSKISLIKFDKLR